MNKTGYVFTFQGKAFTPGGQTDAMLSADSTTQRNKETERKEIEWLRTGPDNVFLYVRMGDSPAITTWLGTVLSTQGLLIGPSVLVGGIAGPHARKRSIDTHLFGVRYVGWYYESAGDYCRLRKSKRQ